MLECPQRYKNGTFYRNNSQKKMKSHFAKLFFALLSTGVLGGAATCISMGLHRAMVDAQQPPTPSDPVEAAKQAQIVLDYKCAACHAADAKPNSFLNTLSLGLMQRHIDAAKASFTLEPDHSLHSGVVDYLKMDRVLSTRRMPPASYSAVHLGSALTPADVAALRSHYKPEGAQARMFMPISPVPAPAAREEKARVLLGQLLYNDPRLSTTNEVSCASCHDLTKGGTDNKPKSDGVPGTDGKPQKGGVNAPSVYNAAGNIRQFWDGRAANLKEQAGGPPLNPVEMGYQYPEDWQAIADKLGKDPRLAALFALAYGDEGITGDTITDAIAAYEQTLVTPDSDFDRYLKGDTEALSSEQKQGLKKFVLYGCATCHAGPTLGGISFENINTHADLRELATKGIPGSHSSRPEDASCAGCHPDGVEPAAAKNAEYQEGAFGRMDFTKNPAHKDLFRVPNLRNVALTWPYFHTGTVDSLEDAVRIMCMTQNAITPSETAVREITAFLHAQTGKLNGKPVDQLTPEDVAPPATDDLVPAAAPAPQLAADDEI